MKKLFMMALAALFAGSAMALDNIPESGFSYQGLLGMNVSGIKTPKGFGNFNSKVGIDLGLNVDYMLPNAYGTYVNAGLHWSQKGGKKKYSISNGYNEKNVIQAHYLEIPVHVGYRYNFSDRIGVYGDLGPYFAIGVTGKNKWKYDDPNEKDEHTMTFGKNFDGTHKKYIQRFDCGFGFRVGAEYNQQYSFNLAWDWGITDIMTAGGHKNSGIPNSRKMKNHVFTMAFGYRF